VDDTTPQRHQLPRIQHVSLLIPQGEQKRARTFYADILGFAEKPTPTDLDIPGLIWFSVGEESLEIHLLPHNGPLPASSGQHFCIEVPRLNDVRERLSRANCRIDEADPILNRPRFFCYDPFDNMIEFTTLLGDYR
jgi:catechol 2,3-dioxygenase-like lactoylglutathione lyase family enzyme